MAAPAQAAEALSFTARDGVQIAADFYRCLTPGPKVLVISPGFAQHKGMANMAGMAEMFSKTMDVLILDYRGTGRSHGRFWFGSKEIEDLRPLLRHARSGHTHVKLLGFSLGAYTALRTAVEEPGSCDELYLVSCPTRLDGIVSSGGAFLNPLILPFQKLESKAGKPVSDPFFRWGPLFAAKPSALDLAPRLLTPVSFLAGGRDNLVFLKMSRKIYEKVNAKKNFTEWKNGMHAEAMYLEAPKAFEEWVLAAAGE